ncbi:MAG: FAD-binding oxidoreductase [Candidatus Dormibacteraceae bacterium]
MSSNGDPIHNLPPPLRPFEEGGVKGAALMALPPALASELRQIVGGSNVIDGANDLRLFERDASIAAAIPDAVVLPGSRDEVVAVMKLAARHHLPVVARGAATGLSGGAIALQHGIALQLSRMRRIISFEAGNASVLLEPGVVNADLQRAAARRGRFYAPDPSSQNACTLGGNVAENSGGPHCLYYGVTANHILGVEVVLAGGEVLWLGDESPDQMGLDLLGAMVGSEGTLGVVTRIRARLLPLPESVVTIMAAFPTIEDASQAVSAVIGGGVIPVALEMMDQVTIGAVEAHYRAGYPTDAGAVLLAEIHGIRESTDDVSAVIEAQLRQHGASQLRVAGDSAERELLWAGRKGAIGALGHIKPNYYLHDGVVPRTRLPGVLEQVGEIARDHHLPVANVFHAGDGNLHPNILFDLRERGVMERVESAGVEMMRAVVEAGGTLSGEHGIGVEKNAFMPWIFSPDDLDAMHILKNTLDPEGRLNPGKIFPDPNQAPRLAARAGVAKEATWW